MEVHRHQANLNCSPVAGSHIKQLIQYVQPTAAPRAYARAVLDSGHGGQQTSSYPEL